MEDLDPRRFEDLVRQLVHGFRAWRVIEPTGRLGSDEGIDMRAEEVSVVRPGPQSDEEDESGESDEVLAEGDVREWRIQCKRYKRLHPKAIVEIVDELVPDPKRAPYGILIAAAADISAEAFSAFHARAAALGVSEHHFWSRSVIEDRLYRPEHDHLLFAYFGISIQARRRSMAATIRSQVALKKQLRGLLEKEEDGHAERTYLLLRDPTDTRYPREPKGGEPPKRWIVVRYDTLRQPGRLIVIAHEHPAWLTPDRQGWDALFSDDLIPWSANAHLLGLHAWSAVEEERKQYRPKHDFWSEYVPEPDKAWLRVAKAVPLDRVIAIDPTGDGYFPIPQLFVDFHPKDGPFAVGSFTWFHIPRWPGPAADVELRPDPSNRVRLFPDPLPASPYPAPVGMDHGKYPAAAALSAEATSRLSAFLEQAGARRKTVADSVPTDGTKIAEEPPNAPFVKWRDDTALPTFSAAAERLRSAGEHARVVMRSSPGSPDSEASELVELRFNVHVGSPFNPDYRPDGHVRVAWSAYRGLSLDLAPMAESSGGSSYAPPHREAPLTREGLTQARLEKEILAAFERMLATR
jgi:hypothetical protein